MRYGYYRRGRGRRSTGVIKMKFQSFMDISTSDSSMQVITISAGGRNILKRCPMQFAAYKFYRLGTVSVKLVPASTLPVDPTGLSISVGDQKVDPRDQLTPGLIRITNGEDVFENITGLSDAEQHGIYNNMLLDPRWFKWMLQSGVKRYATPRFWQIGQLHQDKWPGAIQNHPLLNSNGTGVVGTEHTMESVKTGGVRIEHEMPGSSPYGFFQIGHTGRLGWLPTDGLQPVVEEDSVGSRVIVNRPMMASPPEIEVMKLLLPKAYKTKYWYRAFITETVYFKSPIVTMAGIDQYRPLDVFHANVPATPYNPQYITANLDRPQDYETGGNYGNN